MKKNILLILTILIFFLSGCGVLPLNQNRGLNGTAWTLDSYSGTVLLHGTAMTAFIQNGEINGSASCNHYFGSYTTKGDQIQIEGLGWTEMACMDPEGIMDQEQQVMAMFSQAEKYSIEGQILQITTSSGEIMIFQQIENRQ